MNMPRSLEGSGVATVFGGVVGFDGAECEGGYSDADEEDEANDGENEAPGTTICNAAN